MSQGVYPYQYEEEKSQQELTTQAGLPFYLEFAEVSGLLASISKHLTIRALSQGWTDTQMIMSLILLNLTGGESVTDIDRLEKDRGLCRILRSTPTYRLPAKTPSGARTNFRWPTGRSRTFPSESSIFRYLSCFHDASQETMRQPHVAFIPKPNAPLRRFSRINRDLIQFVQGQHKESLATLDMDAVLVATQKRDALYCYKHYKAYQPVNIWWAEQQLVLHTEFRDGNVPAQFELLRVFQESLRHLPPRVQTVRLRSDSAGYQHDLLSYCECGKNERFGRIEFMVACDVTSEFKKAVLEVEETQWQPRLKWKEGIRIPCNQQWAEVCFVPAGTGLCSKSPVYRYLAVREPMEEKTSKGEKTELPFQTIELSGKKYKLFGRVTNRHKEDANSLLNWLDDRGGKSEEAHSIMKEDLAGGRLPSGDFGENAAWWWVMVLALNLNNAFKRLVLGPSWLKQRLKGLRTHLIHVAARVLWQARQVVVRIEKGHLYVRFLLVVRNRIAQLVKGPSP